MSRLSIGSGVVSLMDILEGTSQMSDNPKAYIILPSLIVLISNNGGKRLNLALLKHPRGIALHSNNKLYIHR